jgi:hypothetical protein
MLEDLRPTLPEDYELSVSCLDGSAAMNRNWCIDHASLRNGDIAIMLDDDIDGFYPGWINDLAYSLRCDDRVVAASARLMTPDGLVAQTCSKCYKIEPNEIEVPWNGRCVIPTAAIAFRYRGHRFDEGFIGSGWEDNDWFAQYVEADPSCKFIQSNRCRLVHRNNMLNQKGMFWQHNQEYFHKKWVATRSIIA